MKMLWCLWCTKEFPTSQDLFHHIAMDHDVSLRVPLEDAAKESRKTYGVTDDPDKPLDAQCPWCFIKMNDADDITKHFKEVHNRVLLPEIAQEIMGRMKALKKKDEDKGAKCTNCLQTFYGVIATKVSGKAEYYCFNCYEDYWGHEALGRLMMGTPHKEVARMRIPIKNI